MSESGLAWIFEPREDFFKVEISQWQRKMLDQWTHSCAVSSCSSACLLHTSPRNFTSSTYLNPVHAIFFLSPSLIAILKSILRTIKFQAELIMNPCEGHRCGKIIHYQCADYYPTAFGTFTSSQYASTQIHNAHCSCVVCV